MDPITGLIVVKVGGAIGNQIVPVLDDLATFWHSNRPWVLVHGASSRTNEIAEALGNPPQFITSTSGYVSRRTDRKTMLLYAMAHAGDVNTQIVEGLQARKVNAIGLSGIDGRLLEGERKKELRVVRDNRRVVIRDDYTGIVEKVNSDLLLILLGSGYAPVICPPALSYENEMLNVDADRAAAKIAASLCAATLILLTSVPGVLSNPEDSRSIIRRIPRSELSSAIQHYATGRMRHKLLASQEALDGGVSRVIIAGSGVENPVEKAIAGIGTIIE